LIDLCNSLVRHIPKILGLLFEIFHFFHAGA
jgi:hypothetical protein